MISAKPTETLRAEHEGIKRMLAVARKAAGMLSANDPVDVAVFGQLTDFFANFADKCHHGKEERHLFKEMEAHGVPVEGGPIAIMLGEHDEGRRHIRGMREALARLEAAPDGPEAERARTDLARETTAYADLLEAHIRKENVILFPMADRVLPEAVQTDLEQRFERVEAEEMGEGTHERYHRMIHELEERFGLA